MTLCRCGMSADEALVRAVRVWPRNLLTGSADVLRMPKLKRSNPPPPPPQLRIVSLPSTGFLGEGSDAGGVRIESLKMTRKPSAAPFPSVCPSKCKRGVIFQTTSLFSPPSRGAHAVVLRASVLCLFFLSRYLRIVGRAFILPVKCLMVPTCHFEELFLW